MMSRLLSLLRYQGPRWLAFRAAYALKRRGGWLRKALPCGEWEAAPGERTLATVSVLPPGAQISAMGSDEAVCRAERICNGNLTWFSWKEEHLGFPPDWFHSPWARGAEKCDLRHWSEIGDFEGGDIKGVWEQGRFGFVWALVRAHARSGDPLYPEVFWRAVEDWREKNPPQRGPHWMCGQEVALRLIAWVFGLMAFRGNAATTPSRERALAEMIEVSARRIEANLGYALSQKNNHGMSEAAGLFTAGVLLDRPAWTARGRGLLEMLARELIYNDGSFSQHSVNYHRLMLHVYLWVIRLGETAGQRLSLDTLRRVGQAGTWLRTLLNDKNGHVPNLGSNDGAHLLDLTDLGYLDYRPTVQAVGLVIEKQRWLPAGPWDELAAWLGVLPSALEVSPLERPTEVPPRFIGGECCAERTLRVFRDGGYAVWRRGETLALLRCVERFCHRPSQCDLLHFDLWHRGQNLLRDAGTYSYNCEEPWRRYFDSSEAHNTVRFDDRDPMPRLSRFLYGAWPRGAVRVEGETVSASYRDHQGMFHRRTARPTEEGFEVQDRIEGPFREAVLRWRLDPGGGWKLTDNGCGNSIVELTVRAGPKASAQIGLNNGLESTYYWRMSSLPVLEIRVGPGCRELITDIRIL